MASTDSRAGLSGMLLAPLDALVPQPSPNPRASRLYAPRWIVPGVGPVRVRLAQAAHASRADELWPRLRRTGDQNLGWSWRDIINKSPERFAILDVEQDPVAFFSSRKSSLVRVRDSSYYRPDRLEVHPALRGGDLGVFVVGIVCARALGLGADGILVASLPGTSGFYERLGGEPEPTWQVAQGLRAFVFRRAILLELKEATDELLDKSHE